MKERVRVKIVQCGIKPFGLRHQNIQQMLDFVHAESKGFDLIVFPEMIGTGYKQLDNNFKEKYIREGAEVLRESQAVLKMIHAAKEHNIHVVFGMGEKARSSSRMYNSAILLSPNKGLVGIARKLHIPKHEKPFYSPGPVPEVFDTELGKIGMMVCYDLFFPEVPRILALKGAEIIIAISCFISGGKGVGDIQSKFRLLTNCPVAHAIINSVYMINCNATGNLFMGRGIEKWQAWGHSVIVSPLGEIVSKSKTSEEDVIVGVLSAKKLAEDRRSLSLLTHRRPEIYNVISR